MTDQPIDEEQLLKVFRALREHEVEYAVFGGIALGLHGLVRATADIDLFIRADQGNIERLKEALRSLYDDPSIDEISADDLCGAYPAVRYWPPEGFGFVILTRLGEASAYERTSHRGEIVPRDSRASGKSRDPLENEERHGASRGQDGCGRTRRTIRLREGLRHAGRKVSLRRRDAPRLA